MADKLYDPVINGRTQTIAAATKTSSKEGFVPAIAGSWDAKENVPILVDVRNRICLPVMED